MKAVVMAGGEGSRLRPMTANRPKPMVPILNAPIMEHILRLLKQHGITDVVATLHYLADEIQSYFDDGSEFGIHIDYSIEDTPLGTAGSVKKAEDYIKDDSLVIISGDALTDCDLTKAIEFHKAHGGPATLVLARVPNPLEFGVVILDQDKKVTRFYEKPSWSEVFSDTVNTGIYILEPSVLDLMQPGRAYDWSQDIFPRLLESDQPIYGYVMDEYWCDVGNLTQYREAQDDLLSRRLSLGIDGTQTEPGCWVGDDCHIEPGVEIMPPVFIGRNCRIKAGATIGPFTVLGDHCIVENDARIERSVLWESCYVGPSVGVRSAIVGSRVTIKRDSQIQEEAVIGDRCLIDIDCTIRPRIKLWPDKVIERGSIVTMSLVWGNKWRGNLFRELGVAGLSNIEITPEFATRLGSAFGSTLPNGSHVVTSRDSTRSSRMIKRAFMASLLSVGCNVLDLRSTALPVARHFIKTSGTAGAMNARKLPGNNRVTLIELFDSQGAYLSKSAERKVETAFFREDFHRIDPDELGTINYVARALEEYESDFFANLQTDEPHPLKIVCDFGFGATGSIFPVMLGHMGVETISINSFNDAKRAPRTEAEIGLHLENLSQIVSSLGYDFGVLFTNEGERLAIIDRTGQVLTGNRLLAAFGMLFAKTMDAPKIVTSINAPDRVVDLLRANGAEVIQTAADTRSVMQGTMNHQAELGGDLNGGFIFPRMHPGFDAMFALGKMITLLQKAKIALTDLVADIPEFAVAYSQVRCPWESKGAVMRLLSEEFQGREGVETTDGIKIRSNEGWALIVPDAFEQTFHVYAEGEDSASGKLLVERFSHKIEQMQSEISRT